MALSPSTETPLWYALVVRPRHEKSAARDLRLRGLEEYSPTYRSRRSWSDRVKWVAIVGFGGADEPIEEGQIETVRHLTASGLPLEPGPYLQTGDAVRIEHGALAGVQGIVLREKGMLRVVVNIDLLRRSVAVELDRHAVTPLTAGAARKPVRVCATAWSCSASA
jgi:hypothetical protein